MIVIKKIAKSFNVFDSNNFKAFVKRYPEYNDSIKTIKEFKRLLSLVQERAILEMQLNPYGIIFPDSNCVLFINNKGKTEKKAVDFHKTKVYGKIIYHTNILTDQNVMKITYLNKVLPSSVENSELYSFFPERPLRKRCSDFFKDNFNNCLTYGKRYGRFKN
jgi:hypothetical protein